MTKVEAIRKVLEDNNGVASWKVIYSQIEKYYPDIKRSIIWKPGIRGVLYREIKNNRNFKKIGLGIFALIDYKETSLERIKENSTKMHSYIEGICIELGNIEKYETYTADPSAKFNDLALSDIVSVKIIPYFTYEQILNEVKRIDVIWFNKGRFMFPKSAYEIIDSIGTMENAFSRTFQISDFRTNFFIIGKKEFEKKFKNIILKKPYNSIEKRYKFIDYDKIIKLYKSALEKERLRFY